MTINRANDDRRAFFVSRNGERKWTQDVPDFRPRYEFPVPFSAISGVSIATSLLPELPKIASYRRVYEREVNGMPVYWEGWNGRTQEAATS